MPSERRVLFVEDCEDDMFFAQRALNNFHFQVNTASSLALAEDEVPRTKAEIVFLDIKLPIRGKGAPWADFEDILGFIKRHSPSVAVMMLTDEFDPMRISQCLDAGAVAHFTKAFMRADPTTFTRKVDEGYAIHCDTAECRNRKVENPFELRQLHMRKGMMKFDALMSALFLMVRDLGEKALNGEVAKARQEGIKEGRRGMLKQVAAYGAACSSVAGLIFWKIVLPFLEAHK